MRHRVVPASPTSAISRVFRSGDYANLTCCRARLALVNRWVPRSAGPVSSAAPAVIVELARPDDAAGTAGESGAPPMPKDPDTYVGTPEYLYWAAQLAVTAYFLAFGQSGMVRLLPGRLYLATLQKRGGKWGQIGSRGSQIHAPA